MIMPAAAHTVIHEALDPFHPGEIRRVAELFEQSLYGSRDWVNGGHQAADRQQAAIEKSLRTGSRLFIANALGEVEMLDEPDDEPNESLRFVGAAVYQAKRRPCGLPDQHRLTEVAVIPGMRSRGVGSTIISFVEDIASEDGAKALILVNPSDRARHLYNRLGYRNSVVVGMKGIQPAMSKKLSQTT